MAYFPANDFPLKDKWIRIRGVAEKMELPPKAKEKLEWIIFYHTVGKRKEKIYIKSLEKKDSFFCPMKPLIT